MASQSRVQRLLDELGDSGCTPEQVCAACPDLLPEVRRRWLQMCAVKADLHALFPTPGSDAGTPAPRGPAPAPPAAFGRYQVRSALGAGGFGAVYLGHDTQLDRPVAIKVLRGGARSAQAEGDRALQEARRLAQLRHCGIVAVHDVGEHE